MPGRPAEKPDTRGEFVEAAWELFARNGYERTTVNAIIEKVGLSKGAFYHYFESKEDVLDAVVEDITMHMLEGVEGVLEDPELEATHKLDCLLSGFRTWKSENLEMVKSISMTLYRDENIIIRHKIDQRTDEMLIPPLSGIIEQGIREGSFDVDDPRGAAEMVLVMIHATREMQMHSVFKSEDEDALEGELRKRIRALARLLERFLGAPAGTIVLMEDDIVERFVALFG